MRLAIFLVLAALPALSQIHTDLATTRDGSVLYFSYRNPSTGFTKIYRWTHDSGVTLFADRPDLTLLPPHHGEHLYGTQLTDAGSVIFHAEPQCATGMGPGFNDCTLGETQIMIPGLPPFSEPAFLLISPNGRYGVFTPFNIGALWVDWFTGEEILVDFHQYLQIPQVSPPFSVNQHAVANNGSFLMTANGSDGLKVWSKTGETVLFDMNVAGGTISADGTTVAAGVGDVYNLVSGQKTHFAQPVSLSDDGKSVAYLSNDIFQSPTIIAQAMVANADGTNTRQITNLPDGIRSVVISGDARYIFVVSANIPTKIQRYTIATGAAEDIPPVP